MKSIVQEIKELLALGFALQQGLVAALADGKLNLQDIGFFLAAIPVIEEGIKFDPASVKNGAWKEAVGEEGRAEIMDYVRRNFDLPDNELEDLITDTIDEIVGDIGVAVRWSEYRRPDVTADISIKVREV